MSESWHLTNLQHPWLRNQLQKFPEWKAIGLRRTHGEEWSRSQQKRNNGKVQKLEPRTCIVGWQQRNFFLDGRLQTESAQFEAGSVICSTAAPWKKYGFSAYPKWCWFLDSGSRPHMYQKVRKYSGSYALQSLLAALWQPLPYKGLVCCSQWCDETEEVLWCNERWQYG